MGCFHDTSILIVYNSTLAWLEDVVSCPAENKILHPSQVAVDFIFEICALLAAYDLPGISHELFMA